MSDGNRYDEAFFDYGQWVEFKLNHDVFGIVVGTDIHGLIYAVQLAGSGVVQNFHGVTLQAMEDDGEPLDSKEETPPTATGSATADVIDFTKARELRRNTKTRGVA